MKNVLANQTHSYPLGNCYFDDNYLQVMCLDTNLNLKWKKYIKVGNNMCARVTYLTSCDKRPGVLIAGSSFNSTDPQNSNLNIDFIYRLDSNIVANVNPNALTGITDRIIVLPNPAKEMITVKDIEGNISEVEVYDFAGRKIQALKTRNNMELKLSIGSYSPGWYFIRIITHDGEVYSKKILKN